MDKIDESEMSLWKVFNEWSYFISWSVKMHICECESRLIKRESGTGQRRDRDQWDIAFENTFSLP